MLFPHDNLSDSVHLLCGQFKVRSIRGFHSTSRKICLLLAGREMNPPVPKLTSEKGNSFCGNFPCLLRSSSVDKGCNNEALSCIPWLSTWPTFTSIDCPLLRAVVVGGYICFTATNDIQQRGQLMQTPLLWPQLMDSHRLKGIVFHTRDI